MLDERKLLPFFSSFSCLPSSSNTLTVSTVCIYPI